MGYMGFGLQKWIYTQRARRPFSKDRKPAGDLLTYSHESDYFETKPFSPSVKHEATIEDRERASNRIKLKFTDLKQKLLITRITYGLSIVIAIIIVILIFKNKEFIDRFIPNEKYTNTKKINEEKAKAFKMMLEYGDAYLKKKDYEKAIIEYKQAVKLYPENAEGEIALAKGYYYLCLDLDQDCDVAIKHYSNLIIKYPDSKQYLKIRAEIYTHLGEFNKADEDLNKIKNN